MLLGNGDLQYLSSICTEPVRLTMLLFLWLILQASLWQTDQHVLGYLSASLAMDAERTWEDMSIITGGPRNNVELLGKWNS